MPPHARIRLDRDNNNDMDNLDRQMVAVVRHASPDKTIDSRARDVPIVDATTKCSLALARGCSLVQRSLALAVERQQAAASITKLESPGAFSPQSPSAPEATLPTRRRGTTH
jgi:hypothetical protein